MEMHDLDTGWQFINWILRRQTLRWRLDLTRKSKLEHYKLSIPSLHNNQPFCSLGGFCVVFLCAVPHGMAILIGNGDIKQFSYVSSRFSQLWKGAKEWLIKDGRQKDAVWSVTWNSCEKLDSISVTMERQLRVSHRAVWHKSARCHFVTALITIDTDGTSWLTTWCFGCLVGSWWRTSMDDPHISLDMLKR